MKRRRAYARTSAHPLMAQLLTFVYEDPRTELKLSIDSGVTPSTWQHWFSGRCNPTLFLFEAMLKTLGYKLIIVKDESVGQTKPRHGATFNRPKQPVVRDLRATRRTNSLGW